MNRNYLIFSVFILFFMGCGSEDPEVDPPLLKFQLQSIKVGTNDLAPHATASGLPLDQPIVATFSVPIKKQNIDDHFKLLNDEQQEIALIFSFLNEDKTISAKPINELENNTLYTIKIESLESTEGAKFGEATFTFQTKPGQLTIESLTMNGEDVLLINRVQNVSLQPEIKAVLSHPITFQEQLFRITRVGATVPVTYQFGDDNKTVIIKPQENLQGLTNYEFVISNNLSSPDDRIFNGYSKTFYTKLDSTYQFPELPENELLTLVQQQTFKYFWDFAHPVSGMAKERNTSGDLVTSGGSGFGLMAMIVGIERGFISREDGISRLTTIINFLENADRFHGAWPHWMSGTSGDVIPFSQRDNGGDLVETSFLIQGLITFRQYLNSAVPQEKDLIDRITALWQGVEWNWFTKGENVLYWHWSPNFQWQMNLPIRGYNEALITYVLAASSPTHSIEPKVYHEGWARNGNIVNGKEFYGIKLPVGYDYGGPLFFAHYSFLGLDPRNLKDQYANYWEQNVNHSLINWSHCVVNPNNYVGYSENIWGLTASDNQNGYSAHSPTNDLGVITPTAAISSIPYTPDKSMDAIKTFYYFLGDRLWGMAGFYDAFNPTAGWWAKSYLAIDQGPIVVMIENHRSGLLWNLFMSAPEIKNGLTKLGFTY